MPIVRALGASTLAALLAVAGACGGDDDPVSTPEVTAPPTSEGTSTSADADYPAARSDDRSDELVGRWEVTDYALPSDGGLTNVVGDAPVYLDFAADGTLSYHTGCNEGTTGWETAGGYYVPESALDEQPEGQALSISSALEQGSAVCEGFAGDQDRDLPADLVITSRFTLDGDELLLLDEFLLVRAHRAT